MAKDKIIGANYCLADDRRNRYDCWHPYRRNIHIRVCC
jgi:hypothetical protein